MNIHKEDSSATYHIKHYEPGKILINEEYHTTSVIVRPHHLLSPWKPTTLAELQLDDFTSILSDPPTILLLGTGAKMLIPAQSLLTPLFEKGIGVEFMDSKAACYTYTILANDERNVAACILIK
jgi:uncharacterized protein